MGILAPETGVAVSKASVLELPQSCRIPDEEPPVGEFGYVVATEGGYVFIDSDIHGAGLSRKMSIVSVDNVVQGEKSKTVMMKRIGVATVIEIGPRTARALRIDTGAPLKVGMKVLPGTVPESFNFTETRLRDIDLGL